MNMSTDDLVIISNLLVAVTSILVAAATEHEAVKSMRDSLFSVLRTITHIYGGTPDVPPPHTRHAKRGRVSHVDSTLTAKPGDGEEKREKGQCED